MTITIGMLAGSGGALTPSYRASYTDPVNKSNYSFSGCDLGTPHATRMIAVIVHIDDVAPSAVTVDGVSATQTQASGGGSGKQSIWQAAATANATGTISITNGTGNSCTIHVFALYPSSQTAVDSGVATASNEVVTVSDIAKTNGGFTIIGGYVGSNLAMSFTQTGAETIIENYDAQSGAAKRAGCASHVNTATTTLNDYTVTATGASRTTIVAASWF